MKSFMDNALALNFIKKLEKRTNSQLEHDYLQKILSASLLIQAYTNSLNLEEGKLITRYYRWLVINFYDPRYTKKEATHLFVLKIQIEKYFRRFGIEIGGEQISVPSYFEQVKYIAQIWGFTLKKELNSVLEFFSFFSQMFFGIPEHLVQETVSLFSSAWKPILAPLGMIPQKKFFIEEIERYFFGNEPPLSFQVHVKADIDRLFTIHSPSFESHIFLPKQDNFDLFEASLVVHEFQHLYVAADESLFVSEKTALDAERVFLQIMGSGKRGKYCWVESNLFYPVLLLKWELDAILSETTGVHKFHRICGEHGMKNIMLSPLFDWSMPFQMGVYCAATMDIEQNWRSFLRDSRESYVNA